jgi:predicted transcriptional regulator
MGEREYDLGASELEVLRVLWDTGAATVRDVMLRLEKKGRRLAYTTVLTYLTRLEKKGFVVSDKGGLAYVYRAKLTRERVRKSRIRSMLSQLYDGAAGPLVLQLVRMEQLEPDEIRQLQELIESLDGEPLEGKGHSCKIASRGKDSTDVL